MFITIIQKNIVNDVNYINANYVMKYKIVNFRLQTMLRIIKRYNFAYKTGGDNGSATVPSESISMSSYPGMIYSMDDFYTLSSGLAVMETTIINYNRDLWKKVTTENTVRIYFI